MRDLTEQSLSDKVDKLSEKIDTIIDKFTFSTVDLVNELQKEKEKVELLTKCTKDCIEMNDQV